MGNLSNQLASFKTEVSLEPAQLERNLIDMLDFDLDLTENEEYFREDTVSLGYENEAERLVKEYLASNTVSNKKELFECCDEILTRVFDSSFYGNWTLEVVEGRGCFHVVVSYEY